MGILSGNTIQEAVDVPGMSPALCFMAASGVVAASTATATIAAQTWGTNYLSGFQVTGSGASSATTVTLTITGLKGGNLTYVVPVPAGVNASVQPLAVSFYPALPASGPNVAIAASLPSFGSGNAAASVNIQGFNVPSQI